MRTFSNIKIGTEKYPALTGIRACGASVVFFDHFPLRPDARIIINVMAFFFVLSGFLIVRIYYQQVQLRREWLTKYFINRFARIYPVYFLLLGVAVLLTHERRPWVLIKNFTLTHALFRHTEFIIEPSWTLTVEECFYLLAPLFMLLIRRRNFLTSFGLGWLLLLCALLISRMQIGFLVSPVFVLSTTFFGHFVEFFAGVYLALIVLRLEGKADAGGAGRATLAGLAGVALLVIAMVVVYRHSPLNALAIILINNVLIPWPIALLYFGLMRENTVLSRALSGNMLGLLGRSSYSFYLLHAIVIGFVGVPLMLPAVGQRGWGVLLTFVLTWLLAVGLFYFFEEPLNILIRRRFRAQDPSVGMRATWYRASTPR